MMLEYMEILEKNPLLRIVYLTLRDSISLSDDVRDMQTTQKKFVNCHRLIFTLGNIIHVTKPCTKQV